MKKLVVSALAALALGLAAAAPAYADEDSFLAELANDGFSGSADAAVQMGHQICEDVASGVPEATTVQAIYENTGDGVEQKDAQFVYDAAVAHLC
jgi:hypothetical protein